MSQKFYYYRYAEIFAYVFMKNSPSFLILLMRFTCLALKKFDDPDKTITDPDHF